MEEHKKSCNGTYMFNKSLLVLCPVSLHFRFRIFSLLFLLPGSGSIMRIHVDPFRIKNTDRKCQQELHLTLPSCQVGTAGLTPSLMWIDFFLS